MANGFNGINRLTSSGPSIINGRNYEPTNRSEATQLNKESQRLFGKPYRLLADNQKQTVFCGWFDIPGQRTT